MNSYLCWDYTYFIHFGPFQSRRGNEQKYLLGNKRSIKKKKKKKQKKGERERVNTHAENHVLLALIKGMKGFFR